MDLRDTIRTYRLFSGSYDIVFGPVFHPGRKEAVRVANDRPGQRILEVGIGTGLSLPYFRADSHVTGIDISAEMLAKAKERVARRGLAHVDGLSVMDAEHLEFEDNAFDAVLALYVASVVPSPARFASASPAPTGCQSPGSTATSAPPGRSSRAASANTGASGPW